MSGYSKDKSPEAPNLTPEQDADLAAQNQALAAEHGIDLTALPLVDTLPASGDARTAADTDRRVNDPADLTDEEKAALAETERLAEAEERRVSGVDVAGDPDE